MSNVKDDVVPLMRTLYRYGVTHFVVSDALAEKLHCHLLELQSELLSDVADPSEEYGSLTFRGNRIFTQADLKRLQLTEASTN